MNKDMKTALTIMTVIAGILFLSVLAVALSLGQKKIFLVSRQTANEFENNDDEKQKAPHGQSADFKNVLLQSEDKTVKMLFFGDVMIDRHVKERIDEKGFGYLFEDLTKEEKNFWHKFDLVSANLEGAVTDFGAHYDPQTAYDFAFDPESVKKFQDYGFNYFSLANNHFYDQGPRGIVETRTNLAKRNFLFSGSPDRVVDSWSATTTAIAGRRISLLSFSMVYGRMDEGKALRLIAEHASTTDLTIVNVHWGVEYEHKQNSVQAILARQMIESGAGLIIGHHPHVVQGMERYKGKYIFYSLGNFIFDQYFSADTQEGLAVGLDYNGEKMEFSLFPYQSENSRIVWLDLEDKAVFLEKFAGWSDGDEELKENVVPGKFL